MMILRNYTYGGLMRSFAHFTLNEREVLQQMVLGGRKQREMAQALNKSQSAISRELSRLGQEKAYLPIQSHAHYMAARTRCVRHRRLLDHEIQKDVVSKLKKKWSPEIIANTQSDKALKVSTSTIYRSLKRKDIPLLTEADCLRRRGKRRYCRGGGKTIQNGRSIHLRSDEVNNRVRIGDWEGDTVLGAIGKGLLVTIVDRKSRFLLMAKSLNKTAKSVKTAIVKLLSGRIRHTLTLDNGAEFAQYDEIEKKANVTVYFADTHSPWQRGSNENLNELIRWYFPKGTDFTKVSDSYIKRVCNEINQRPRKVLGWKTPEMVYSNMHLD